MIPDEARTIAKEAFLWGMHPVGIFHLRYNFAQNELNPGVAGINRLSWFRRPMKALPRVATTPNATTLYGVGMFDLSREPAVITVPEIKDHYWSVRLHDNYARWWHLIGSQFNAPGPVRRLLLGPNWSGKLPAGFVALTSCSPRLTLPGYWHVSRSLTIRRKRFRLSTPSRTA